MTYTFNSPIGVVRLTEDGGFPYCVQQGSRSLLLCKEIKY